MMVTPFFYYNFTNDKSTIFVVYITYVVITFIVPFLFVRTN